MATIIAFPADELQESTALLPAPALDTGLDLAAEDDDLAEVLVEIALDGETPLIRRLQVAAHVASAYGGPELREQVLPLLDSDCAADRQVGALLLGSPRNLAAIFPLVALLDDPSVAVRRAAVEALAGIRNHRVLSFLLGVLDRDDALVATTLSALKLFPIEATEPIFRAYLDHPDPEVVLIALGAYMFVEPTTAVETALPFIHHLDPRHRGLAVTILEASGQRRLLEPLFPLLRDPDQRVCRLAREAITTLRPPRA